MIDVVWSWHTDVLTCGVAKWNVSLARHLGLPCEKWPCRGGTRQHPLISLKISECDVCGLELASRCLPLQYDLLLHDYSVSCPRALIERAGRVYAANSVIAAALADVRPDVIDIWCPGTIHGDASRKGLVFWTLGMGHKLQRRLECFRRLKEVLDDVGPYTLAASSGLHDGELMKAPEELHEVFGDRFRFTGFLADDQLERECRDAHAIVLFFDPAFRTNHTTAWWALTGGKIVVTNLDHASPDGARHDVNLLDIHQLREWPDADLRRIIRNGAVRLAARYSWERLLPIFRQ